MVSRKRGTGEGKTSRRADDAAIIELLDTVREARTTLAIDLSTAAGALEEGQPRIAHDILSATSEELVLLRSEIDDTNDDAEVAARRHTRKTRALLALPAIPLIGGLAMTTAAALSSSPSKPAHHVAAVATQPTPHTAASTALRRLEDVVTRHAKAEQVIAVADDLHKQLTRLIATSTNNPAQLHVVRQLLTLEQHVLEGSKLPGTQLALAASRAIAQLLEHRPTQTQPKPSTSSRETPHAKPAPQPTTTAKPKQTHVQRAPQPQPSTPTTHTAPSPNPTNPLFGDGFFNWP